VSASHYRATLAEHPPTVGHERREGWAVEVTHHAAKRAGFTRWTDPATLARGMGCTLIVAPDAVLLECGGVIALGQRRTVMVHPSAELRPGVLGVAGFWGLAVCELAARNVKHTAGDVLAFALALAMPRGTLNLIGHCDPPVEPWAVELRRELAKLRPRIAAPVEG